MHVGPVHGSTPRVDVINVVRKPRVQQLPAVKITSVDNLFIQHSSSTFLTFWAQVRIVKMSVKTRLGRWFINVVREPSLRSGVTTRHSIAAVGKITSVEFLQTSVVNLAFR